MKWNDQFRAPLAEGIVKQFLMAFACAFALYSPAASADAGQVDDIVNGVKKILADEAHTVADAALQGAKPSPSSDTQAESRASVAGPQGAGHVKDERVTADRIALGARVLPAGTYAGHGPLVRSSPMACTVTVAYDPASSRYTISIAPALHGVSKVTFSMMAGMPILCNNIGVRSFSCSTAPDGDNDNERRFSVMLTKSQSTERALVEIDVKNNKMPSKGECYFSR